MSAHPSGISRRTLTSTAAWTVPTIAVAVAAPLAAASPVGTPLAVLSQTVFHENQNHLGIKTTISVGGVPLVGARVTVSILDTRFAFDNAGASGGGHYGFVTFVTDATGSFTGAVKIVTALKKVDVSTFFIFAITPAGGTTTSTASAAVQIVHNN
ncbi:hypothetical protein HQQ80_13330 [Microbacteriaceae bacterium VKM Ac-2855]|nr:hypothetical protein [Microbacteriaceae bacterium VKM Ac-2855]